MAKHLNVSLGFTADAGQAKRELQELQRALNNLVKNSSISEDDLGLIKEIQGATRAAAQLAVQLKNATNVNTGNLDLTKFSESMKASGMNLEKYATQLSMLGPAGEKAFVDLTRSITLAEVPLKRTNKMLNEMWTTMKNTARWQLTSSAMHGFMGAVSSAYRYVEDLNASLNDIRIVTGYSADKMASFAIEANKAAKALSTTTTAYTDASLIYYQQGGMTDEEIAERTEITVKMANAAGESAEKVSNQLTSVWNNFYDGSKSLEYYADVLTKLGAVTASSTDEISEGVNKFASVAGTIGLSYEYAASALATVTATTRESADVVGTAFKTLFARIQGLNLGETLDDGTTLNKYSQALEKVGINIFDQNNQIKQMDTILNEMGAKWQTISKDQQIALAQTVAGVRQYTQLTTLMDNWDFFQQNIETSYSASGTLNEQAEIYAESWEAANKRVQASAEAVYTAILDDEFFINLTDGFGEVIDKIGITIESLGGVKGTLFTIGNIFMRVFSKQIGNSIDDAIFGLRNLTKSGRESWIELKKQTNQTLIDQYKDSDGEQNAYKADIYTALGKNQLDYIDHAEQLNQEEQAINQLLLDRNRHQADVTQQKIEELEAAEAQLKIEKETFDIYLDNAKKKNQKDSLTSNEKKKITGAQEGWETAARQLAEAKKVSSQIERLMSTPFEKTSLVAQQTKNELESFGRQLTGIENFDISKDFEKLASWLGMSEESAKQLGIQLNKLDEQALKDFQELLKASVSQGNLKNNESKAFNTFKQALNEVGLEGEQLDNVIVHLQIRMKELGMSSEDVARALFSLNKSVDEQSKVLKESKDLTIGFGDAIVNAGNFVMGAASAVTTFIGTMDVLQDETASTGDKIMALVSGLGSLIPIVQSIAPAFSKASVSATVFGEKTAIAGKIADMAMWKVTLVVMAITALTAGITYLATKETEAEIATKAAKEAAQGLADAAENAKTELENLKSAFDGYDTAVEKLNECVKGTTEWEEALKNVNAEVISLLEKYPELSSQGFISGNASTGYIINSEGREYLLNRAQAQANGANFASLNANTIVRTRSNYDELQTIGDKISDDIAKSGYFSTMEQGEIQSIMQSDRDQLLDAYSMTSIKENLSLFAEYLSDEDFINKLDQIGISSNFVSEALLKYKDTITEIAINEQQNLKSRDMASEAYISSILGAEASEIEIKAANAARKKTYDKIIQSLQPGGYDETLGEGKQGLKENRFWRGSGGENNQDVQNVWKRYGAAIGKDYDLVDLSQKNGIKGFTYLDENAEKQFVSIAQLSDAIASFETASENFLTNATQELKAIYNTLGSRGQQTANTLSQGAEKGNFTDYLLNFSDADLSTIANAEIENYSKEVEAALGLTETNLKTLAENFSLEYTTVFEMLIEAAKDIKEDIANEDFSELGDTNQYSQVQKYNYNQARNNLDKNDTLSNLSLSARARAVASQNRDNIEGVTGFMNELVNLDFKMEDSTEKLKELAEKYNLSGSGLDAFIAEVDELPKFLNISLDKARNAYSLFQEHLANLKIGDTIKDEEIIQSLEEAGINIDEYFDKNLNGTYKLTKKAEELAQAINDIPKVQIREAMAKERNAAENSIEGTDLSVDAFRRIMSEGAAVGANGPIADAILKYTSQIDLASWSDEARAAIDKLNQGLNLEVQEMQAISESYLNMQNGFDDGRNHLAQFADSIVELNQDLLDGNITLEQYNEGIDSLLDKNVDSLTSVIEALSNGEELDEAQLSYLKQLEEQWPVLEEVAEKGSKAYTKALQSIRDAFSSQKVKKLYDKKDALEIDIKADPTKLEEQLDEITDVDREISIEIVTNAEQAFKEINDAINKIDSFSNLIAKDFTISRENIVSLAKEFPGILEGYTVLEDGIIQLNEQSVQSAMFAAQERQRIETEEQINKYQNRITELQAQKDLNKEILGLLEKRLETQSETEGDHAGDIGDLHSKLTDALQKEEEIRALNSADSNNEQIDASNEHVMAEIENSNKTQIAWRDAYRQNIVNGFNAAIQQIKMANEIGQANAKAAGTEYEGYNMQTRVDSMGSTNLNDASASGRNANSNFDGHSEERTSLYKALQDSLDGLNDSTAEKYYNALIQQNETIDSEINTLNALIASLEAGLKDIYNTGERQDTNKKSSGSSKTSEPASPIDPTKLEDIIDRYKELEDALDDLTDALNDANKMEDRLWGQSRIDNIEQQNQLLQKQMSLLKEKIAAAKNYLAIDKATLDQAAKNAGVNFVYDEAGNLTNYTQQMEILYAKLRAAQNVWNADYVNRTAEEQQEYEKNILQPIQDKIDELKAAIDAYERTREELEDFENELDDAFYEWQDNNYEMLHHKLEVKIEINDLELEMLDYYLNKLSDDFYQLAESAQFMVDKIPTITDSLGHYESFYNDITAAYAAGEISQADYVDGMKESYSAILDNLTALNDLDKEMLHYYEETLAAASEELDYYTNQLEHLTNVLDHYRNIVELVNGEFDYKAVDTILRARTTTIKNELDVATANYQMLLTEKAAVEASLAGATDDAAREVFENELKAITTAVNEAQEEMLSKTEQWAEAMKEVMENTLAESAHKMEMSFTDGIGFDRLNDSLDRLSAYANEYLTKTNQIYETQKLMNTAQMAIDKTTNAAAKVRLNNYIQEIEVLQDKNKLSKLELDIAQARYEVLLAEIALEEAQNAKSVVRLQRDNEGNFGYVYTADQEAVSKAEQELLDAQNDLYNIGLEGANEYGEKLLELQQQLSDQLIALEEARAEGQFATDAEYYAARDKLISEYTDLFKAYSEQYTTALGVDTNIQQEAWITAYDNMIDKSLDWKDKTTEYTEACEEAYESWREAVQEESEIVDSVLNDLESEVKDVTNASNDLRNQVVNSIIPAINSELIAVRNVTSAYAAQRAQIQELIAYYERLAQAILNAIRAQASASQNTNTQNQQNYAPVEDYSRAMAEYLAENPSHSTSDDYYQWLMAERNKKMQQDEYKKYQGTAEELYNTFEQYGKDSAVTDYVNMVLKDNKKYFYDAQGNLIAITSMASGGYTGAWGPEGRLAVLHEKELVLNQQDTENLLTATNVLRQLAQMIDLEALHSSQGFGMSFNQSAQISSASGELEQIVTIEAHFPSVQDRNEIEEAFNNLINTASQYANRKNG